MKHKVCVITERDQNGFYAHCPTLEGCQSQGETFEDVCRNIQEAIVLYWETLTAEEIQILLSTQVIATDVEVAVD